MVQFCDIVDYLPFHMMFQITVNNFPAVFGRVCLRPLSGCNFVQGVVICHVGRAGRRDLRGKLQPRGQNYNHAEVVSARVRNTVRDVICVISRGQQCCSKKGFLVEIFFPKVSASSEHT